MNELINELMNERIDRYMDECKVRTACFSVPFVGVWYFCCHRFVNQFEGRKNSTRMSVSIRDHTCIAVGSADNDSPFN